MKKDKTPRRTYYPIFVNLDGKRCVVIGGGAVAERKVKALLKTGAKIILISPEITDGLKRLAESGAISLINKPFRKQYLKDAFLVIAATSSRELHKRIAKDFKGLLNVVDSPELCNFIVPSTIRRGPLTIAISSSGTSPAMTKMIRKELESLYPGAFGEYLEYLGKLRKQIINLPPRRKKKLINLLTSEEVFKSLRQLKKVRPVIKDLLDALSQQERKS